MATAGVETKQHGDGLAGVVVSLSGNESASLMHNLYNRNAHTPDPLRVVPLPAVNASS